MYLIDFSVQHSEYTSGTIITLEPEGAKFHYRKLSCNILQTMMVSSNTSVTQNTNINIWSKEVDERITKATMEILYQNTTSENSTLLVGQIVQVRVTMFYHLNVQACAYAS